MNRQCFTAALRLCLLVSATIALGAVSAYAKGAHLFILSGQSNMNGLNPADTLTPALHTRLSADQVIVVKDSHGGQSIRRWDRGWTVKNEADSGPVGDLYGQLLNKVNAAVEGREIRTVTLLWMQGEKDARLGNADIYAESFHRLLGQLRNDLDYENINYIIGRLSDFGTKHPDYPDWNKMRDVLVNLADASKRSHWVNTDDLNDGKNRRGQEIKNDLHYSASGYREFGKRMAEAAIRVLERNDLPYDLAPPAKPPYYRVRYEGSEKSGELRFPVQYTVWVPPGVKIVRGLIVHQHGCGPGSCRSGQTGAFDFHWQALAEKHDCALFAAAYEQPVDADCSLWCDPLNGSDAAFQRSLVDLANAAEHPELATVPWALWGHSGGGVWAGSMLFLHPDRVAAVWLRSGCPLITPLPDRPDREPMPLPVKPIDAPVMLNLGTEEGFTIKKGRFASVWPVMQELFIALRKQGTPIGTAIDPLTGHQCGNQRYLAIPWFDTCLSTRLPATSNGKMKPMATEPQWLAPLPENGSQVETKASPAAEFSGDPLSSVWLPNAEVAKAWEQYVRGDQVADTTPPPAPTNLRIVAGKLNWTPKADLQSGIAYFIVRHNGQQVAKIPTNPTNPFGRPLAQGLLYSDTPDLPLNDFHFAPISNDISGHSKQKHDYTVSTVNTAGLESRPSNSLILGLER